MMKSAADPSQLLSTYVNWREKEQATRQFCDTKPFKLHDESHSKPDGQQVMYVPLIVFNGEQSRGHSDTATRVHRGISLKAHLKVEGIGIPWYY